MIDKTDTVYRILMEYPDTNLSGFCTQTLEQQAAAIAAESERLAAESERLAAELRLYSHILGRIVQSLADRLQKLQP